MPAIMLKNVAAGVANAVDGLNFQDIPEPGALVTISASTPTAGALISYSVGTEQFLVDAAVNIEGSADVISNDVDRVLTREPVPAGKQFLSVAAQIANVHIQIDELPLVG